MMHGMGWGAFGMGVPFFGAILPILVGVGLYVLFRRLRSGDRVVPGSARGTGPGGQSAQRLSPQADVFRLAKRYDGVITVSDVVTEWGIGPDDAQRLLDSLADGQRVVVDVDREGVLRYTFRELVPQHTR